MFTICCCTLSIKWTEFQVLSPRVESRTYRFHDQITDVFDEVSNGSAVLVDITWNIDDYLLQLRHQHRRSNSYYTYHASTAPLKSVYAAWVMRKEGFRHKEELKQGT